MGPLFLKDDCGYSNPPILFYFKKYFKKIENHNFLQNGVSGMRESNLKGLSLIFARFNLVPI